MPLIKEISNHVKLENVIWEAPLKAQQAWFIKHFGSNVNLGNIAPNEIIPLETLRLGLRGDTFFQFLPDNLKV
jgi:phosphosulfolactate synthase